ncbi:MAG: DUF2309 family protein [Candidatus Obscuribacter sp.]|nr:DUF2309 family protein [Candidatus Obscuribacter sp.]
MDSYANSKQTFSEQLLTELEIEGEQIAPYLRQHITHLPGFASHLKWRQLENGEDQILTDYLAIRLHYEKMLAQALALKHSASCTDLARVKSILSQYQSLNGIPKA